MTRPKRFGSLTLGLLLLWSTYSAAQQFPKSAMVKPDGKETDVMLNFEADKLLKGILQNGTIFLFQALWQSCYRKNGPS